MSARFWLLRSPCWSISGRPGAARAVCSPPVVDELAEEHSGEVYVGKVNIDEEPELAARFGVMSIPTLMLFRGGEPVSTSVGVKPKHALEAMLK